MGRVFHANNRRWLIGVLLVTLLVRALIPAGFMPASDRPLSFQICPDGFPAALLKSDPAAPHDGSSDPHAGHHHHGANALVADASSPVTHHHDGAPHNHGSASVEHCVFAATAGASAAAFTATFSAPAATLAAPQFFYVSPAVESRRFSIQQPRGPPALS
jgi:hypothetical protein